MSSANRNSVEQDQIHDRQQSQCVQGEDKEYSRLVASSDQWQMSRAFRVLALLEEAGGDEKLETKDSDQRSDGDIRPESQRGKTARQHHSAWNKRACRQPASSSTEARQLLVLEWRATKLARIIAIQLDKAKSKASNSCLIQDVFGGSSCSGVKIQGGTTLFARRGNAHIITSVFAEYPWTRVNGLRPMAVATLIDLGWTSHEQNKSKSLIGDL